MMKYNGNFSEIQFCSQKPEEGYPLGDTPLHKAVRSGNTRQVLKLIKRGADVNAENSCLATPLHIAVNKGYPHLVKILLMNKADQTKDALYCLKPIHFLYASPRSTECLMEILNFSPDLETKELFGHNPVQFMMLTTSSSTETILFLLKKGCNPNNVNIFKNNCFHYLFQSRRTELITKILSEALIKYGCDLHAKNNCGDTPLHCAVRNNKNVIKFLIDNGADINAVNDMNHTPVEVAANENCRFHILNDLIQHVVLREHSGLYVKESVFDAIESKENYREIRRIYNAALVDLKNITLPDTPSITYYDLLCKPKILQKVGKNHQLYTKIFASNITSMYSTDIIHCLKAEVERQRINREVFIFLNDVLGKRLPVLCIERIVGFLEPKDTEKIRVKFAPGRFDYPRRNWFIRLFSDFR